MDEQAPKIPSNEPVETPEQPVVDNSQNQTESLALDTDVPRSQAPNEVAQPQQVPEVTQSHGRTESIQKRALRGALALTAMASSVVGISTEAAAGSAHPVVQAETAKPQVETPVVTETKIFTVGDSEQYAREFTSDPEAGVLTQPVAPEANAAAIASQLKGEKIESVTVQGSASAEDDGPNAGVTTPSPKNVELADKRAELFTPQLEAALAEAGVSAPEIEEAVPIEDSWNQGEVTEATALASQFGYEDYASMIEAYNLAPQNSPPDVREFLNQALQSHRDVRVMVVMDEHKKAHVISVPKPQKHEPGKDKQVTTINRLAGYIPRRDLISRETNSHTPHSSRRFDSGDHISNSQVVGNHTQARAQKQPLPRNYTPNSTRTQQNKSKSMNRSGHGRGK